MTRVLLINPPATEPTRAPLLSFCYLAASLRRAGHAVAVIDGAAPFGPRDADAIAAAAARFGPDLVGIHLKTLNAQRGYALARRLFGVAPLLAGGPHATVCPDEPLDHGFSFVLTGEAEESLCDLAGAVGGGRALEAVPGLRARRDGGALLRTASGGFISDLNGLPDPVPALDLFDPAWYGARGPVAPGGVLSSRGCPAGCTFCANNVTGRRFRFRAAGAVAAEIDALADRCSMTAFSFFDDSFAVGRRRVRELCAALRGLGRPLSWTCTAHPAHLDADVLDAMKAAGCGGIDIGMESADPDRLVRIVKGVTVERVLEVLEACHARTIPVVVNLMLGWPDETAGELSAMERFMRRAAPLAAGFNARGVLVPYPGTRIYDEHHPRFGFTEWWLREPPIDYEPFPTEWSKAEILRAYASDAALDRNFFAHGPDHLRQIADLLALKADLTLSRISV